MFCGTLTLVPDPPGGVKSSSNCEAANLEGESVGVALADSLAQPTGNSSGVGRETVRASLPSSWDASAGRGELSKCCELSKFSCEFSKFSWRSRCMGESLRDPKLKLFLSVGAGVASSSVAGASPCCCPLVATPGDGDGCGNSVPGVNISGERTEEADVMPVCMCFCC